MSRAVSRQRLDCHESQRQSQRGYANYSHHCHQSLSGVGWRRYLDHKYRMAAAAIIKPARLMRCRVWQQGVPMLTEKISGAGNGNDPDRGAKKIEESKGLPAHAEHPCQRSGKNPQAKDEAGKENSRCAVAGEHILATFYHAWRDAKNVSIAIEQRTSAIGADGIAQIAAEGGGGDGNHDDPAEMEMMLVKGHKTSQQERDLARNRDAGAFGEQRHSNRPVAIVGDEGADEVDDPVVHEETVLSSRFSVLSYHLSVISPTRFLN